MQRGKKRLSKNLLQMKHKQNHIKRVKVSKPRPETFAKVRVISPDDLDPADREKYDPPSCPHGPTILFEREDAEGQISRFFACSSSRDRKGCHFYFVFGTEPDEEKSKKWEKLAQDFVDGQKIGEKQEFLAKVKAQDDPQVRYCHSCSLLFWDDDLMDHKGHELTPTLTQNDLKIPTDRILDQLDKDKREAQYHFTEKSLKVIMNSIEQSGAKNVLCLGAPTIFEHFREKPGFKAFLLDIDTRLASFWGPDEYAWYNMFNHHFFTSGNASNYQNFLEQASEGIVIVTDPPFGGKPELVSTTLRKISAEWRALHGAVRLVSVFWVFPYFMEQKITGSNPCPGSEIAMSDYQVNYTNHRAYSKQGSPVRIFTNVPLSKLVLPEDEGYKHCVECDFWVCGNNSHCSKCEKCPSKNGSKYAHCDNCGRCVKATWAHCEKCGRCALKEHPCNKFKQF